ncbi:PREDICTED: transcription factor GTE4-like isoform X2 [Populus euphratica]|uniref:Transcription factor GTE4-like isoform X2 n=1 Tax=Populus euphratica TaxID=75702 RepID=A0AAJ6TFD0_POPEU|nr:PREDICTED: transcription factor GTE4-like isoform X2 [Populus euphratica]
MNSNKKLKQSGGGKDGGAGKGVVEFSKDLVKGCGELLGKLMKHQYGWVFNEPVDAKKLKLHDYYKIIKHPMDLGTVKSRLSKNWYKSPKEFAEDVRLTFNNAMKYNEKGQDVHTMADTLLKIFEEKWANVQAKTNFDKRGEMGYDASLPTPALKRAPGPRASSPARGPASKRVPGPRASSPTSGPASASARAPSPASFPQTMPLETKTLDRTDSLTELVHSKMKAAKTVANQGRKSVLNKPKKNETVRGVMTYEEKQKLSIHLQSLPSEKLESVVQIIRKRNPGLFQQEDEIEVDIDCFDNETLWELHGYVTNYQKSMGKNEREAEVALQGREEAGHKMLGTNMTSATAEAPKELGSDHRQGHSMSRSSSSSSSGSDSRSSSSGSDSDSGSGSDAAQ